MSRQSSSLCGCTKLWLLIVCLWLNVPIICESNGSAKETSKTIQRNVSCSFFADNKKQVLNLGSLYLPILNITLNTDNGEAIVECILNLGGNFTRANGKLIFRVKENTRVRTNMADFVRESGHVYKASLDIAKLISTRRLFHTYPFILEMEIFNHTTMITRGHLNFGTTGSFSKFLVEGNSVFSHQSYIKWRCLTSTCNLNATMIIPANLTYQSFGKTGLPIAIASGSQTITVIRWEHLFLPWTSNQSTYKVVIANRALFFYSQKDILLVEDIADEHHGNKTRDIRSEVSIKWQISEILSVSILDSCSVHKNRSLDTAVLFRFPNASVAVMLSYSPYISWDVYGLPDWLRQGSYFATVLMESMELIILLSVKEPLVTMVTSFNIPKRGYGLKLQKAPFIFEANPIKPKIMLVNSISSLIVYDDKEVWLSTSDRLHFVKIFSVRDSIHTVVGIGRTRADLAIISLDNIHLYSSTGLQRYEISQNNRSIESLLWKTDKEGALWICWNAKLLNTTMHFEKVLFKQWQPMIPSFFAEMSSKIQVEMRFPSFYEDFPELLINWRNLCLVPRYPNAYLCDSGGVSGRESLTMITDGRAYSKMFRESEFRFERVNSPKYLIQVRNRTADIFTEEIIGQTFQLLNLKATCLVYWVLNEDTAQALCDGDRLLDEHQIVESKDVVMFDSRGSERCYNANVTLNSTDTQLLYHLHVNFSTTIQNAHLENSSYARLSETSGKLLMTNGSRFIRLRYPAVEFEFKYICILSEDIPYGEIADQVSNYAQTCHFDIVFDNLPTEYAFLDIYDKINFNITLIKLKNDVPYWDLRPPITIKLGNKEQIAMQVHSHATRGKRGIHVLLTQKPNIEATTVLDIHTTMQPKHCNNSIKKITIYGTCPPQKKLVFEYPIVFTKHTWLNENPEDSEGMIRIATIPYNYQPQSHKGKAIPMTRHIYNADPSKPMHRARYKVTREMAEFKQCKGKMNRISCGCTDEMTFSSLPEHSDCIQRVYKVDYHESFQPRLYLSDVNVTKTTLKFPYYITEINSREDYSITKAVNGDQMSMLTNSSIKFSASGLYHFRVNVVKSGYTFCDLETYFVIFVADAPLPHPAQDLVRAMTAFCFGSIMLTVFLLKYHTNI